MGCCFTRDSKEDAVPAPAKPSLGLASRAQDPSTHTSAETFPSEECAVCFDLMGGACPLRRLSCGHGFHHACIQKWLQKNSSCPLCKADQGTPEADHTSPAGFRIDMGHQEMVRIMQELEDIFRAVHGVAGPERSIGLSGLALNLCVSLGYEDEDELEEALGGPLADFLGALPHFDVIWPEATSPSDQVEPKAVMKAEIADDADEAELQAKSLTFTISEREDLWRVVLQGPKAFIDIPEIEFGFQAQNNRRVDTIYNMIASAVYNLGDHVQKSNRAGVMDEEESTKIADAIGALNALLDLDQSFTLVISDPQGVSELKPADGVHIELL